MRLVSIIACLLLLGGCASNRAFGVKGAVSAGHPGALKLDGGECCGGTLNSEGTEVYVWTRGDTGKPAAIQDVTVTCESSNPPRVLTKTTDSQGKTHFQVRGPLSCWVDFNGSTYQVKGAPEDKDTQPNQRFIVFEVPNHE